MKKEDKRKNSISMISKSISLMPDEKFITRVDTVANIVNGITTIQDTYIDDTKVVFPSVPQGFSISIKSTDKPKIISKDGKVTPPSTATNVILVLTVTKSSDSTTADTQAITVTAPAKTNPDGLDAFRVMKYGFFVHYVKGLTVNSDGTVTLDINELADNFDSQKFADEIASFGVEYIIFTAWHANMVALYPSVVMEKWGLKDHTTKRDLIGDMIKAVKSKDIKVLLYTHPRDGHDMTIEDENITGWNTSNIKVGGTDPDWKNFDKTKWNNFINDVYGELINRYGNDIEGIYADEGSSAGDSYKVVDYSRLRNTVKSRNPNLIMIQNYYGTVYSCDICDQEYCKWGAFAYSDGNQWPANTRPIGTVMSNLWYASVASGNNTVNYSPESIFRYTVLEAGVNTDGGGVQWAT